MLTYFDMSLEAFFNEVVASFAILFFTVLGFVICSIAFIIFRWAFYESKCNALRKKRQIKELKRLNDET